MVRLDDEERNINDVFFDLNTAKQQLQDDKAYVFWGMAYLNRTKYETRYNVKFALQQIYQGVEVRPNTIVDLRRAEFEGCKKAMYNMIQSIENSGTNKIEAFVFGYPEIYSFKLEKEEKQGICIKNSCTQQSRVYIVTKPYFDNE